MVFPKLIIATASFGLLSASVLAATDGVLGSTSTGSVNITAQIDDLVNISRLDDIDVGSLSPSNLSATENFCVYRNGTGAYQITASGSGAGDSFSVSDGALELPYTLSINGNSVSSGVALSGTGANTTSVVCGATDNTVMVLTFDETQIAAANTGTYTGSLTLTVAPE